MSEILLSGLLAERASGLFPHARLTPVLAPDIKCQCDVLGMAVLSQQIGQSAELLRLSRMGAPEIDQLERIKGAYHLMRVELNVEYNGQERIIQALTGSGQIAKCDMISSEILDAVFHAPNIATARGIVIGAEHRLAAYELASNETRPHILTHKPQALTNLSRKSVSTGFYSYEEFSFQHPRFDGGLSEPIKRETMVTGDAVIVLPIDPEKQQLVLIEQIRPAALARRSQDAWGLEAVAGLIDRGETPLGTAQREIVEEAGLSAQSFYELPPCYQSPGSISQMMYLFFAQVDLTDYQPGIFGLENEGEDIRSHLLSYEQAIDLLRTGEVNNAPLQILLYALALDSQKIHNQLLEGGSKPV